MVGICEKIGGLCTGEYIGACRARVPDPPEKQAKACTTMQNHPVTVNSYVASELLRCPNKYCTMK